LILFYLNYKRISVIDNTRVLMKKILVTRKTVKRYVIFNLAITALIVIIVTITTLQNEFDVVGGTNIILITVILIALLGLTLGIMWLFYQLLYGFLLKKLNTNYKELAKLDTNS
jgi:ABC-type polysaccharide/polyol phosphate export permease